MHLSLLSLCALHLVHGMLKIYCILFSKKEGEIVNMCCSFTTHTTVPVTQSDAQGQCALFWFCSEKMEGTCVCGPLPVLMNKRSRT